MTLALVVLVPSALLAVTVGSELGVIEAKYQPMKIAAAEAQWTTCQPCSFSLFQIGGGKNDQTPTKIIAVPHLLSLLATNSWNGKVTGLNEVNSQYQSQFGPGSYVPNVFVQYWSMRVMAYLGGATLLFSLWGAWLLWRRRIESAKWFLRVSIWAVPVPFVMNTAGWLLTENGRQPWIVQGLQLTRQGVSPSVSITSLAISLSVFILLYGVLAVVDWALMLRYSRRQLDPVPEQRDEPRVPVAATHY
jgi:cytochrome d ubiquinol oxidase subunit I